MELNGALLNRALSERLLPISGLARRLAQFRTVQPVADRCLPRRPGVVRDAVLRALAESDRSLRAREIHAAAQELAGMPLSWNTVKDCLHKNARRPEVPIERVSRGRYQRHAR
jgi:hypothetical protein